MSPRGLLRHQHRLTSRRGAHKMTSAVMSLLLATFVVALFTGDSPALITTVRGCLITSLDALLTKAFLHQGHVNRAVCAYHLGTIM